jgi:ferredoxin
MGEFGPGGRGRGGGGGRGRGTGQGMRRRDGSGRGASPGPTGRADGRSWGTTTVADTSAPSAVRVSMPAAASRAHTVAVVAKPGSCIACGTCVETCPRDAITLAETAEIDASICTGCGLCVNDCSCGALALAEI